MILVSLALASDAHAAASQSSGGLLDSFSKNTILNVGLGWSGQSVNLLSEQHQSNLGGFIDGGYRLGFFFVKAALLYADGQNSTGVSGVTYRYKQSASITSVNAGISFGRRLSIEGGYGSATIKQLSEYDTGSGFYRYGGRQASTQVPVWVAGISIYPVVLESFSIGLMGRYYEAFTTSYEIYTTPSYSPYYGEPDIVYSHGHLRGWLAGIVFTFLNI